MKTNKRPLLNGLAGLAVLLSGTPLLAHHAFSAFDMSKTITVTGVVKEFQWINPHSWIQMMVTDASGNAVEWSIEMNSPLASYRLGFRPRMLKAGDQVTIVISPVKDGSAGGQFISAADSTGRRLPDLKEPT